ncbi:MAG: DUF2769 domain-containing protein [Deltaproteobacteria bacterium]|nr:DUF2769 domain-containing protein [Deltaproteobacteria bacterium]
MARMGEYDRFGVENMGKEEFTAAQERIMQLCKCPSCPTYVKGDKPYGYCFPVIGTSSMIKKEVDCKCFGCDVYKDYSLDNSYFCTRCSQLCQTFKKEAGGGHE